MTTETIYAQVDPTTKASYQTVLDGPATYSVNFSTTVDGVLKEIWFYSPSIGGSGTALPNHVGIWVGDTTTPVLSVTPTWSGGEGTGWLKTTVTDTAITAGTKYLAGIGIDTTMKQAYLYAGIASDHLIPHTSAGGHITASDTNNFTVHGPVGPAQSYSNATGLPYPSSSPGQLLNWLVDVGIDFTPPGPPSIDTTSLPGSPRLYAYSATVSASAGSTPYAFSISAGSLPTGLSINSSTGVISGTPTVNGTFDFTVTVTDHTSQTASKSLSIVVSALIAGSPTTVSGISTYAIYSGINNTSGAAPQNLRVLPPTSPAAGRKHAFLWVLPVEPGQGTTFGDGIQHMKDLGAHNAYNLTCIMPGFPVDTDTATQQDTFVMDLVSWAEATFGTGQESHYLIGFSKSGFGGQELFWHHQDKFSKVGSWDAATDYQTLAQYDGAASIGSQGNLTANKLYDPQLSNWKALGTTGGAKRIFLAAGVNLVTSTSDYAARLTADGIKNDYTQVITDVHGWVTTPDWVAPMLAKMFGPANTNPGGMGAAFI
jgi:hypothetical protein